MVFYTISFAQELKIFLLQQKLKCYFSLDVSFYRIARKILKCNLQVSNVLVFKDSTRFEKSLVGRLQGPDFEPSSDTMCKSPILGSSNRSISLEFK